jgi:hypothetical protein
MRGRDFITVLGGAVLCARKPSALCEKGTPPTKANML